MAIVKMSKLNLVAMSYDRDTVLNSLQKTGASEIKLHYEAQNTAPMTADCESLRARLDAFEGALSYLSAEVGAYNKDHKIKTDVLSDGFSVSYTEFISAKEQSAQVEELVQKINTLADGIKELNAALLKTRKTLQSSAVFSGISKPFSSFADTAHTKVKVGTVPAASVEKLLQAAAEKELSEISVLCQNAEAAVVLAVCHKTALADLDGILQDSGFVVSPYSGDERSGEQICAELAKEEERLLGELKDNESELYSLNENIKNLKIYCDYLRFELEKAELSEKLRATQRTFLLEAYVPDDRSQQVSQALDGVSSAVYYEFSEPDETEVPPTLYKNNAVVKNFETITNTYSPPNSKEFDPNTVMALFYSVFLGFIMADMGYGLMMLLGGGFLWYRGRGKKGGIASLAGVFAVGGIFTIIWGFLFNSLFGFELLPFKVMPDLQGDAMSWTIMGTIKIPALLIISMLIGVVQLFVGYMCKAHQCWRKGHVLDGIFDGVVWAVFSIGIELAIVGFVDEFKVPVLQMVGAIIAGVSLLVAMLTAGRKEKLLGKFTKGFGAAYGVINYASDILSYARLYGLMLAGAVIANIITENSVNLISSGNGAFVILGVLIMVIGHVFNLAIGLLGAYIHDARLQYVEFYGRFFEGEGELFTPLGSEQKYINLLLN